MAWVLKTLYSCTFESILVASPPGMATAQPKTQGTTEGSAYGPVHHWGKASCPPGPLYKAVSEEGPKQLTKTPATLVIECSLCFRTASSSGVPSLGPKGFLTASTPKTPEQLIKWLPELFAFLPHPHFYTAATLFIIHA